MSDNGAQKKAAAYHLAVEDSIFLASDAMRGVRLMLEYAKAESYLRAWGIASTVVVFGSAEGGTKAPTPQAASDLQRWYNEARRFGRIVSERGGALTLEDGVRYNVIATGGGPGIMEGANRGAHDAGAPSIGFNIELHPEQEPNPYSTPDLTFLFHFFAMRKLHLAMRASALAIFPGGFGTFDELFEILTLTRRRKIKPMPILCFDRKFWTGIFNFDAMVAAGVIDADELNLITFVDDAEEAWAKLVEAGILRHPRASTIALADEPK